jgi:methionyl-tRNA synthetase
MPETNKFYLTTPIYYVNARPHLGTAYSTMVSDVIARRKRDRGADVFFLTGTDEHGQKIQRSAAKAGITPQQFTDNVSSEFRSLWQRLGLTNDDFIRTTEARHKRGVQQLFTLLKQRGFIYKGTYTGQYCVSDEAYVEGPPGTYCPDCGTLTETVSEENYYFKLSAFERPLLELYEREPEFIRPETRRNEVLAFVRGGLKDLSISRTSFDWGIPVPGDEKHVVYVWMDALANYITALGWGSEDAADVARFEKFWPADLHIIGKEISRFHCVYWPAFLMAAGLPLPKSIFAHGWLLFEQSKMSKSRGNVVRAETVLDVLGSDALRYFLLRETVFGQDGSFSFDALVQRYNADLANGYGNLVSRTLSMIGQYFDGVVPGSSEAGSEGPDSEAAGSETIRRFAEETVREYNVRFEAFDFSRALETLWMLVARVDGYITETAPWKVAKSQEPPDRQKLATILYTCAEAIRIITALVHPVLPEATARIWTQLGLGDMAVAILRDLHWGGLAPGTKLGELAPIFPRAEKDAIQRMQEIEANNQAASADASLTAKPNPEHAPSTAPEAGPKTGNLPGASPAVHTAQIPAHSSAAAAEHTPAATTPLATTPLTAGANVAPVSTEPAKISIDDFAKVELRVAKVLVAERVPKADKLLRLEVDLGYEQRQILAGIAESYTPESLIGRKVVIVANLAPRKLRGLESNGMIVAASVEGGKAVLAGFLEDIEIGARLK